MTKPKAVVSDIDGCLAHFLPLLQTMPPGDWDYFHRNCYTLDLCIDNDVKDTLVQCRSKGMIIVIVSNRPEKYANQTASWLNNNGIPFDQLWLHPTRWKANVTWKTWMALLMKKRFDLMLAIDDDPVQCELYRELEIPVKYVHSTAYDENQPWRQASWERGVR